jgi:hypothetical protein
MHAVAQGILLNGGSEHDGVNGRAESRMPFDDTRMTALCFSLHETWISGSTMWCFYS